MKGTVLSIGIDDTDSPKGMCTTFLAYKIAGLIRKDVKFLDFPRLIRFNPNIPWKTRGNGAVSFRVQTIHPSRVKRMVKRLVEKYADTENGANPGLVFFEGTIPESLSRFGDLALWQLIRRSDAKRLAVKNGLDYSYHGNGQGLVGAIGAIGYDFGDHTLELLSYRKQANFGKKRLVSTQSVQQMHEIPGTFNSYDAARRQVLITPHGPDPVFYGIRGEDVGSLLRAANMLKTDEKPDGYMIFMSNQGTGDHLRNTLDPANMKPYSSGMLMGTVQARPQIAVGGHVFFSVVSSRYEVRCAVYRPTGMSSVAARLIPGDKICVGGGIRKASKNFPRVLNVELFRILNLKENLVSSNPFCTECSKSMKSKGRGQGYMCVKCGKRSSQRRVITVPRNVKEHLYLPAVSAHRHLARPVQRIERRNLESKFKESLPWFV